MSRVFPGLLGTFGPGTLVVGPEYSQAFLGLLDLGLWQSCLVGYPGMSRVFPGLLGTFGRGTLVVMVGRISRDVPSIPRTSFWTWDFGSHVW